MTMDLRTSAGATRELKVDSHGVAIDDSRVTQADIAGSNGVIHAIDERMLPPKK